MSDSKISGLTAQLTLHDADLGVGVDTTDTAQSAQGTTKKWSWTLVKAFLKTYFDGLYLGIGANATTATTATNVTGGTITSETLSTGTKLDANADPNITQYGMARQAIMNGNFDVWQRGTSVALADVTKAFQADRFHDYIDKNGGTLPTLTRSRQLLTSGDIANAFYYTNLATNGAGTSLGTSSYHRYSEFIENGVRNLCGLNKKVTVSFWAKSDIANKRICPTLTQNYGTTGSPTTAEKILGTPITLTSTWTKYTATFTTNTLVGKTFGTDLNDYLALNIFTMWGTVIGNTDVQASVTAETYVGAGYIAIAQVQICSGDVALPFQPKSYEEELRACQRYYEKSYDYGTAPGANAGGTGLYERAALSVSAINSQGLYKVIKRATPTVVIYATDGTASAVTVVGGSNVTGVSIDSSGQNGFREITKTSGFTAGVYYQFQFTAESEL